MHARAHVILFSSDLTLSYDMVIDYYGLRFQIEVTFRDAKQYWGLEDFLNVTAIGVTNAANLALFYGQPYPRPAGLPPPARSAVQRAGPQSPVP